MAHWKDAAIPVPLPDVPVPLKREAIDDLETLRTELEILRAELRAQRSTEAQAERIITGVAKATAESTLRGARRENPNPSFTGVYTYPEGEAKRPKPVLKHPTYFCGIMQREEQLTPEEIDLFNRFEVDKTARGSAWTAEFRHKGKLDALFIDVPAKTFDQRMSLPDGLTLILRELLDGKDAVDPGALSAHVEMLQKRIADLESRVSTV